MTGNANASTSGNSPAPVSDTGDSLIVGNNKLTALDHLRNHNMIENSADDIDTALLGEDLEDLKTATRQQLCSYMAGLLMAYTNRYFDRALIKEFQKDFAEWDYHNFNTTKTLKKDARRILEYQGVCLPDFNNDAKALAALAKNENMKDWNEEEIQLRIERKGFHPKTWIIIKREPTTPGTAKVPRVTFPIERHLPPPPPRQNGPLPIEYNPHVSQTMTLRPTPSRVPWIAKDEDPIFWELPPQEIEPVNLDPDKISKFIKLFPSEMKYSGEPYDLLDDKVQQMFNCCQSLEITRSGFHSVFPLVLTGRASNFYTTQMHPRMSFAAMYDMIKEHFDTNVNMEHYNTDWTNLTFNQIRRQNPSDDMRKVLQKLFDKLELCKKAMRIDDRNNSQLRAQVIRACRHVPELEPALFKAPSIIEMLYSDLRSSLETSLAKNADQHMMSIADEDPYELDADANYYDRRYRNSRDNRRQSSTFSKFPHRNDNSANYRRNNNFRTNGNRNTNWNKRCLACGKTGCWSTKHPKEQRQHIRSQYITDCYRNGEDPDNDGFTAYIQDFEGFEHGSLDEPSFDKESQQYFQQNLVRYIAEKKHLHQLTHYDIYEEPEDNILPSQFTFNRYDADIFHGIMPDTGAAKLSSAGENQAHAFVREFPGNTIDVSTAGLNQIKFGSGEPIVNIGSITVITIFGDITFYIMPTPTPFLLSIADMDRLRIWFQNTRNMICQEITGKTAPTIRKWGHPWFHLSPKETAQAMLTEPEIRRLHRRFGHPEADRLYKMLTKAGHNDVDRATLDQISKFCHHCQMHSAAPKRFKFTLKDDQDFNYEILADVMYLDRKPVLHIIDVATSFQGATYLKEISARETWEALRRIWIDTYLGPPDIITHDPGTNFSSKEFRSEAKIMGVTCKEVPIEAHWSIGKLERYHAPLRRAWDILNNELHTICSRESILQMAVKAVNDTAGPDGLVPTLLVFGAYPRLTFDSPPSATTIQRASALEKAMKALRQKNAERSVRDALNTRNGPDVTSVLALPIGSEVRVYREKDGWKGPYKILAIDDHDITVDTGSYAPSKFRSTVVRPYFHDDDDPTPEPELPDEEEWSEDNELPLREDDEYQLPNIEAPVKRGRGRPKGSKNKPKDTNDVQAYFQESFVQFEPLDEHATAMVTEKEHRNLELAKNLRAENKITTPGEPYEASDQTEIDNLIGNGVFNFEMFDNNIHGNIRLFKSRMVREIKYDADNKPYEKSRLVVQGYSDEGKKEILTQSPTIQRASQRIILAITPSIRKIIDSQLYLRDITQAYTQSKMPLNRNIYARLPQELAQKYPAGTIIKVIKPLYGIAESGLFWWVTYHDHHRNALKMNISTFDPCLLVTDPNRVDNLCFGIVGMQTDDTLFVATPTFRDLENDALVYKAKDVSMLTIDTPLNFNGCNTSTDGHNYFIHQKGQAKQLALVPSSGEDRKEICVRQRARGAYIASICQPEASYDLSRAAQTTDPENTEYEELNKRLQWQMKNTERGLTYVELNLNTAAVYVFVDGSFANNRDLSSQIGYIVCLGNEEKAEDAFVLKANIIHWSSTKCKRVTRSVLASEIYGMVTGFDMAFCITQTINQIIDSLRLICNINTKTVPLILCTDSYSLYEGITKLGTTAEKRLMIDIMALRESYEAKEITEIRWINGDDNPADAMTKHNPNKTLEKMVTTNEVTIRVEGMVTRKMKGV